MRDKKELEELKCLGRDVDYSFEYKKDYLEKVKSEYEDDYMIMLDTDEFTTLCPRTAQPDFARIFISYIPDKYIVESKSLKLYLFSFRNDGNFHEDCVNTIKDDLVELLEPKYLEVLGIFASRGGIAIYPFATYAKDGGGYEDMAKSRKFEVINEMMKLKK